MDLNEYFLDGMKSFLKSLALKQCKCLAEKHEQLDKYSFDECRSEQFLSSLHEEYERLRLGDKSAHNLKLGVLKTINACEEKLKDLSYCPYMPTKTKLLDRYPEKTFPLVYEAIFNIFYYTDQHFRQHNFHDLLSYYYTVLKQELHSDIISSLDLVWENIVRAVIPLAKLHILSTLFETSFFGDIFTFVNPLIVKLNEIMMFPNILREDCYEIVKNKAGTENFKLINFELAPFEGNPGYLGEYFQLQISFELEKKEITCQMFAKYITSMNQTLRVLSEISFKKETFIYKHFVPKLKEFGLQNIANFAPECYFIRNNDVMILQDLSVSNYVSPDLSSPEDYEWCVLAIKKLAQFHACTFLLENRSGKEIQQEYKEYFREVMWAKEDVSGAIMKCSIRTTIEYFLEKFSDISKAITLGRFKEQVGIAFDSMYDHIEESQIYRNVVCHGDIWLIRYSPPMVDLLFFIYMNTTKNMRTMFKYELLDIYYETLSHILKMYNVDINTIYSREIFSQACKEFESTAICQAICYHQILQLPKTILDVIRTDENTSRNFFQINRSKILDETLEKDMRYRSIMRDMLEDLYDVLNV
ncbi:uncharacterized protein [Leptinotarsa decemlineata]|uniref:uncharacterized protein n=1 Tax=Leptinotarsa decemlineata TaxID=7539 RepID=UPI003D30CD71